MSAFLFFWLSLHHWPPSFREAVSLPVKSSSTPVSPRKSGRRGKREVRHQQSHYCTTCHYSINVKRPHHNIFILPRSLGGYGSGKRIFVKREHLLCWLLHCSVIAVDVTDCVGIEMKMFCATSILFSEVLPISPHDMRWSDDRASCAIPEGGDRLPNPSDWTSLLHPFSVRQWLAERGQKAWISKERGKFKHAQTQIPSLTSLTDRIMNAMRCGGGNGRHKLWTRRKHHPSPSDKQTPLLALPASPQHK